jgi:hypothetical protein
VVVRAKQSTDAARPLEALNALAGWARQLQNCPSKWRKKGWVI